jgi:tRNA A22 N-methylase
MLCVLKEKRDVIVCTDIGCDHGYIKDTRDNRIQVGLFGAEGV